MKIVLNLIFVTTIFCTELGNESYLWPTDASKTLTTVFGDVRPRRYHAGLDVRTYGLSGHDLYAIEDGYIERIRVSSSGYGKAIYIRLIDDRIAVYAHMSEFTEELNELVKEFQLKENSYSINQILEPNKYRVKKGDVIGFTGDTGSISGPHLHFEIRDKNNKPLNPLLTNYSITDTQFPVAKSISVIPLEEISRVNGEIKPIIIPIKKIDDSNYKIENEIKVSGPFGLAVKIIDRINQQPFKFGLFGLKMYIDEELHYSIQYDHFDFDEGELVYTERDYALIRSGEGKYYRLFKDDSRKKLSFHDDGFGGINLLEFGNYKLKIIAYDYNQNEISISGNLIIEENKINSKTAKIGSEIQLFKNNCENCEIHQFEHGIYFSIPQSSIKGTPEVFINSNIIQNKEVEFHYFKNDNNHEFVFNPTDLESINCINFKSQTKNLEFPFNGTFSVPKRPFNIRQDNIIVEGNGDTFYDTSFVWIRKIETKPELNYGKLLEGPWEVGPDFIPYRNQIEIEITTSQFDIKDSEQISIYYLNEKNQAWYYMPTTFSKEANSFKTSALSGEIFALIKEDNPPEIKRFSPKLGKKLSSNKSYNLSFKIKDDLSGIDGENNVEIRINNNKIIHEYNSYRKEINYPLNGELKSGENHVEIIAKDRAGNETKIEGKWILE